MTQYKFETQVVATLLAAGAAEVYKMHAGIAKKGKSVIKLAEAGTPDRLVLFPHGRAFYVEVKDIGDTIKVPQITRIAELTAAGLAVLICAAEADDTPPMHMAVRAGARLVVGLEALALAVREMIE